MMNVKIPNLTQFSGGPTVDGQGVAIMGSTDDGTQIAFSIDREKVPWVISSLAQWTQKAAKKAGWKQQPIAEKDDTGIWMRPTQYGLIDTSAPGTVHLAIDVGPVRFRFALKNSHALELGRTLAAASATPNQRN